MLTHLVPLCSETPPDADQGVEQETASSVAWPPPLTGWHGARTLRPQQPATATAAAEPGGGVTGADCSLGAVRSHRHAARPSWSSALRSPPTQAHVDPDPGSLSRKKNLADLFLRFEPGEVGKSACSLSLAVASCGRRATRSTDTARRSPEHQRLLRLPSECAARAARRPRSRKLVRHPSQVRTWVEAKLSSNGVRILDTEVGQSRKKSTGKELTRCTPSDYFSISLSSNSKQLTPTPQGPRRKSSSSVACSAPVGSHGAPPSRTCRWDPA